MQKENQRYPEFGIWNLEFGVKPNGFTLIETLIGIAIFIIVSTSLYFAYSNVLDLIVASSQNAAVMGIINSEIETIRNMKYEDVGTINGVPAGKLFQSKVVTIDGAPFTLNTTVRSIDDSFDGTVGGTPNDLSPADYKLVELEVTCAQCRKFLPIKMTSTVAPRNLEGATKNGALFVTALDANSQPIPGVTVHIVNTLVTPQINLTDVTNNDGQLQLVDTATSSFGYQVTISKTGYSTDRTYVQGAPENPNPKHPHATVKKQELTDLSLAIDRVSTLGIRTTDYMCRPIPLVTFLMTGLKLIGQDPDIVKYSATWTTDAIGEKNFADLEWDTYSFKGTDAVYTVGGATTMGPLVVDPANTYNAIWNMELKNQDELLVSVLDSNGAPVTDANVNLTKAGYNQTLLSGHRIIQETDWSAQNYDSKSSGIDPDGIPGNLTLLSTGGKYASQSQEWLISESVDFGTANTAFYGLSWNPATQPPETGTDSLQIQIAANNDNSSWNFVGPDGTGATYFTTSGTALPAVLNGNRYIRYKIFMKTTDELFSPLLTDITLEFRSSCFPQEQVFFSGLTAGTYTLTVTKSGYQNFSDPAVIVNSSWRQYTATLTPQ